MPRPGRTGTGFTTRTIAAATVVLTVAAGSATVGIAGAAPAAALGRATSLTTAQSYRPVGTAPVGRVGRDLIVNNTSTGNVIVVDTIAHRAVSLLARDATGLTVSGQLVEYRQRGVLRWLSVSTRRGGVVPSTWSSLAPDGGLRVVRSGTDAVLEYRHLDGRIGRRTLPDDLAAVGATYNIVADQRGTLVVANSTTAPPVAAYAHGNGTFAPVSTTGLLLGLRLRCISLSRLAAGCLSQRGVVRLGLDGRSDPQSYDAVAYSVAVTDGATSWTSFARGNHCPCQLLSVDTTGTAFAALDGLTSPTIRSGLGQFYLAIGTSRPLAGISATTFASGRRTQIYAAPHAPLRAAAPALGPGTAVWVDDSTPDQPLQAAPVDAAARVGDRVVIARGAARRRPATSGLRTTYASTAGNLRRVYDGVSDTRIGRGALIGSSGSRVLVRGAKGHLVLVDLVHGTSTDETTALGARSAALWGGYLSYLRADGSVWRKTLTGGRPVRLAAPAGAGTHPGRVYAWGNLTAWVLTGQWAHTRNARTGAARSLRPGDRLYGAAAAGVLVQRAGRFAVLGWGTDRLLTDVPSNTGAGVDTAAQQVPAIDGNRVAWLQDGRPTVASLGIPVANQPRSLGNLSARGAFRYGTTWSFELPTSAALTHCAVTITRGRFRAVRACSSAGRAVGEVVVTWRGRTAGGAALPAGRYRWRVTGSNVDGVLLDVPGLPRAVTGTVTLTR